MDSYFNENLLRAIEIATFFWVGLFIFATAIGVRATNVYLITGFLIIAILLFIGLISPIASLILSIGFHSVAFLFIIYQLFMAYTIDRKE